MKFTEDEAIALAKEAMQAILDGSITEYNSDISFSTDRSIVTFVTPSGTITVELAEAD